MALLLLLARLRPSFQLDLSVAHVNHCLRGQEADEDEEFVREWCLRLEIPFHNRRVDVASLAREKGHSLEEAGRLARFSFFMELAGKIDSAVPARIALAHHLDDQAETILMHLGRGSGLDGLIGMKPHSDRLIRPLLGQPRVAIEKWLTGQNISWRQDASNTELFALRNRIRHQVIPAWRDALGYDPVPLINRTALSLAEDQQALMQQAAAAIAECRVGEGLSRPAFLKQNPAMQNRVLRQFWLEQTGSRHDLAYAHVCQLRAWLQAASNGQQVCLPGYWRAHLLEQRLFLDQELPDRSKPNIQIGCQNEKSENRNWSIPLIIPGSTPIPSLNLKIVALLIENESEIVYNNAMEYFRLDKIRDCIVRQRLPGDRIHPFGRLGGKSLKKYFNEQKIRADQRARLPLIALEEEIAWLPGYAAGADFVGRPSDGQPGRLVRLEIKTLNGSDP